MCALCNWSVDVAKRRLGNLLAAFHFVHDTDDVNVDVVMGRKKKKKNEEDLEWISLDLV